MRAAAVVALLLAAAAASAKPLPNGTKVVLDKDVLMFVDGDIKVPVRDGDYAQLSVSELKKVDLGDDGDTISIVFYDCIHMEDMPSEYSLAALRAKAENMRGMQQHLKKKYADAIPHFAAAAKGDPSTPVYATNLLSAQSMAGKLDDADQTIATYGAKNLVWFAWRLAVDSDLRALRGRPSTKPFAADKRTKVSYKPDDVATSPLGLVAVDDTLLVGNMPGGDDGHTLAVYDLKTNHKTFEHSISKSCIEDKAAAAQWGVPACTKQELAKHAAAVSEMNELLGVLGFTTQPTVWVESSKIDDKTGALASPDKSVQLVFKDDKLTIARGKAKVTVTVDMLPPYRVGFAKNLLVLQYRDSYLCGGADSRRFNSKVFALP